MPPSVASGIAFDEKAVQAAHPARISRGDLDYMAFPDDARIADGGREMRENDKTLRAALSRGPMASTAMLASLWGIESNYGQDKGDFFFPCAASNAACGGRKPGVFTTELIQALRIVQAGDVKLKDSCAAHGPGLSARRNS